MDADERRAVAALRIGAAPTDEDVWAPFEAHVDTLHASVADQVMATYGQAAGGDRSPLGLVITGERGAGKTHLLGSLRERVQRDGGYFFLVRLVHGRDFWQNVVQALVAGLCRPAKAAPDQLTVLLRRLVQATGMSREAGRDLFRAPAPSRPALDELVMALQRTDRSVWYACRHTVRALDGAAELSDARGPRGGGTRSGTGNEAGTPV